MSVWNWIQSFWKPGDFAVVPQSQNSTVVGRITQLTCANEQKHSIATNTSKDLWQKQSGMQKPHTKCKVYVRPIEEKIKSLQLDAARKRRLAQVKSKPKRRPKVKP